MPIEIKEYVGFKPKTDKETKKVKPAQPAKEVKKDTKKK